LEIKRNGLNEEEGVHTPATHNTPAPTHETAARSYYEYMYPVLYWPIPAAETGTVSLVIRCYSVVLVVRV